MGSNKFLQSSYLISLRQLIALSITQNAYITARNRYILVALPTLIINYYTMQLFDHFKAFDYITDKTDCLRHGEKHILCVQEVVTHFMH